MNSMKLFALALIGSIGATVLLTNSVVAQTSNEVVQGRLSQIGRQQLTVEVSHGEYREFKFDLSKAKCFDFRRNPTTCETLIGVGYADKARLTLVGGVIQRVDILELQQ